MDNSTKKSFNFKKLGKTVIDVLLWVFLGFALIVTIIALSSTGNTDRIPNIGGYSLMTVSSGSMEPVFCTGDLIIVKNLSDVEKLELKEQDVITFLDTDLTEGSNLVFTTHRIVEVIKDSTGTVVSFRTEGDAVGYSDNTLRLVSDVRAIWKGSKLSGMGTVLEFLRSSTGFLLFVVIPLLLLFVYQVVIVVKYIMELKNKGKKVITKEDEEAIKQRAIEEYLRQQAAENSEKNSENE